MQLWTARLNEAHPQPCTFWLCMWLPNAPALLAGFGDSAQPLYWSGQRRTRRVWLSPLRGGSACPQPFRCLTYLENLKTPWLFPKPGCRGLGRCWCCGWGEHRARRLQPQTLAQASKVPGRASPGRRAKAKAADFGSTRRRFLICNVLCVSGLWPGVLEQGECCRTGGV